ncbi:hypothetical protein CFOL_v3_12746 [Cephalotus follicularis]|uniref:UBN2_3 domain-containing protein n=1 Tax=Cephalotus follicularis TaxID=3775 RepID=A0A1Q3BMP7_CEPFO|nr:hypothetical protein CFOL_v3_12746 [Cephalotus follicularis]
MDLESIKVMNQDMVKLDHFDGNNFACWQDKMMFLFTALKISYIFGHNRQSIKDYVPLDDEQQPKVKAVERINMERKKHEDDELLCQVFRIHCLIVCMIFLLG